MEPFMAVKSWLKRPFEFTPFFKYATGLPAPRRSAASKKPPEKDPKEVPVTTMAVGEEGAAPPGKPGGPTTPARGEVGAGDVPTTTIAKGEEGKS